MGDFLYRVWLSVKQWWHRRRNLRLYWVCAVITDLETGSKEYKYYSVWAKTKGGAIARQKLALERIYRSPTIRVDCRTGYTRHDI